jgi:Ca2+-binding EF-hand superfamily protein
MEPLAMKLALSVLGASAVGALALVSVAIAQPPGRGPGAAGFALLQHDANGDGRVTRAEFDAAQKARFDGVDANKDGSATPAEFKASREAKAGAMRATAMTERFDELDTDRNGQLSRTEFSARPAPDDRDGRQRNAGTRAGSGPNGAGPAKRADANADGTLTLGEFSARGAEAFAKADANKDGVVTVTELQTMGPTRP